MRNKTAGIMAAVLTAAMMFGSVAVHAAEDVTPASLAADVDKKFAEAESYAAEMNFGMDMDVNIESDGLSFDMSVQVGMDMDIETTADPEAAHMTGNMSMAMAMGGEAEPSEVEQTESYYVLEDGTPVAYSSEDGGETWKKTDEKLSTDLQSLFEGNSLYKAIADGDLEAELTGEDAINGEEVYVVSTSLSGDYLQEALDLGMNGDMESLFSGIDLAEQKVPAELMFYKESGLPARVSIDMSEMGKALMEASMGLTEEDLEGITFEIDVKEFGLEMTFHDYGSVAEITVPDDVKAAAETDAADAAEDTAAQDDAA